jgi:hypothetical protein
MGGRQGLIDLGGLQGLLSFATDRARETLHGRKEKNEIKFNK